MSFDIEKIKEDFDNVISHSQDYNFKINSSAIFDSWYKNKKWFIDANDGNLIYEYPEEIRFDIDDEEKINRVNNFIEYLMCFNDKIAQFIYLNRENFYENITKEEYKSENGDIVIPKGMKITRAMKFLEKDSHLLDQYQTKMSMLLQESYIQGTLCFSVHPLDFLSLSENNYSWRSCHALDGEYRSGNLSYMLDNSTIVCYLKGEKETVLPNFPSIVPWNNKKWRMLLFFSTNRGAMFAGRQYPFFNHGVLSLIQHIAIEKLSLSQTRERDWTSWTNYYIDNICYSNGIWNERINKHFVLNGKFYKNTDLIQDSETQLHYNDLLKSSVYTPYYCWTRDKWLLNPKDFKFEIGADVPCLYCGKNHINISGSFLCDEHELDFGSYEDEDMFCYCDYCGQRMYVDDSDTLPLRNGGYICSHCADRHYIMCDCCEEYVLKDEIYYDEEKDRCYCEYCYGG